MSLRSEITARAAESGRTLAQQAAYERMIGTAATVTAQREAGIIDARGEYVEAQPEYTVTTARGADAGLPPYGYAPNRAEAIALAHRLHSIRVGHGAEGLEAVRVEHRGAVVYAIRDNGTIIH